MIPEKVSFTDLDIDPQQVLVPRKLINGIIPQGWTRYRFPIEAHQMGHPLRTLDQWIEANLIGRWASFCVYEHDAYAIVLWFEHVNDAVMFKLMDGETAWLAEEN